MAKRYNVYFSGKVIAGFDPVAVRENLGKIFKADAQTLDKLFSGKPRMIKRDCDEATTQKYRLAMERAGAEPVIEAVAAPAASSAADKIAALAAAPEDDRFRQTGEPANASGETRPQAPEQTVAKPDAEPETQAQSEAAIAPGALQQSTDGDIELAPPDTDVLVPGERTAPLVRDIDTSSLAIDASGESLAQPAPPPPGAPNTSHLGIAAVGETIPNLPSNEPLLSPNTDALDLSPEGTDFSDCANAAPQAPALDLSAIEVAPAGADVLDEQYRKADTTAAPDTAHISLEE